jgi:hypothetical protein
MNRLGRYLLLTSLFALPAIAFTPKAHAAGNPARIMVQISCSCDDAGGKAYLQAVHQALSSNAAFQEVSADAAKSDNVIRVNIVSSPLAPEAAGGPTRTSFSITSEHNGATMSQSVETCNKIPLAPCVEAMLEALSAI